MFAPFIYSCTRHHRNSSTCQWVVEVFSITCSSILQFHVKVGLLNYCEKQKNNLCTILHMSLKSIQSDFFIVIEIKYEFYLKRFIPTLCRRSENCRAYVSFHIERQISRYSLLIIVSTRIRLTGRIRDELSILLSGLYPGFSMFLGKHP